MKEMLLSEFNPKSKLVVAENKISKAKYPVIDFHCHYFLDIVNNSDHYNLENEIKKLNDSGIVAVINLIIDLETSSEEIVYSVLEFTKSHLDVFVPFGTVDTSRIDEPDFAEYVSETIRKQHKLGIKGLKFLKDVSLKHKDKFGNYIRIDDKRLSPIWKIAAELNLPVLTHIGDPVAFFSPMDGSNERIEELYLNPEWSFCGKEFFKFDELMQMQENLLTDNPDTTFIMPHGGNYSENLTHVSKQLDSHPNMYIDISAKLSELGRKPYSSREFLIKHQDRILFGTDCFPFHGGERNYNIQNYYYRFLETWDEYFDYEDVPSDGRWKVYGVGLPDDVLKKIYYENAIKLIPELAKKINL